MLYPDDPLSALTRLQDLALAVNLEETCDSQASRLSRTGHALVCSCQLPAMNALGDRQMQRIQGSQRVLAEPCDQTQRRDQVLVGNRVNLQESRANIFLERRVHARFDGLRDLACPPTPGEKAAELDDGQAADRRPGLLLDECLERLGEGLVEIPLRQCAGVEVWPRHRSSRSVRICPSLPFLRRGMLG